MRILVVFAHPTRTSFCGSILSAVLEEITSAGHDIDLLDLYADNFDPALREEEWLSYENLAGPAIQTYVDQLRRSAGLIWIFPTWNYGLPAILKGYVDRVWKPNVAFSIDSARRVHFGQFGNLKFFIVATTFGSSWLINALSGNPGKRVVANCLRRHFSRSSGFAWLAMYNLDKPRLHNMERYLAKVRRITRAFLSRYGS